MFQRSRNLIKSVSPQSVRQADILSDVIVGFLHGRSRRQLHALLNDTTSRNRWTTYKYKHVQKVYVGQGRNFIWSSFNSQDKHKSAHDTPEVAKQKYDFAVSHMKPPLQSLAKNGGGKSSIKEPNSEFENKKENDKSNSGYESAPEQRLYDNVNNGTDAEVSPNVLKSEESVVSTANNEQSQATKELDQNSGIEKESSTENGCTSDGSDVGPCVNVETDHSGAKPASEGFNISHSKSNEDVSSNVAYVSQAGDQAKAGNVDDKTKDEAGKAVNESKVQKGKSSIVLLEKAKNLLRKSSKSDAQCQTGKTTDSGSKAVIASETSPPKRRQSVDLNKCSMERNFITPVRAMTDFLLKPSDLEGLRKTKRRSPYENDPPITVYWRKDVEAKAIDVWGSKENLLKEILKRDIERRRYQQNIFTVKRRLRDYRREQGRETEFNPELNGLKGSTGKVILFAIAVNGCNFILKFGAWWYTGSHSMFSEALHSLADTINQFILAYGIHKSVQRADSDHPYGYTNMRYVASLISGVAIFCLGSGLSTYHGVIGLTNPTPVESYFSAFLILSMSLVSEGCTLFMAFNSIRQGAKANQMTLTEYVLRGNEPSVNVILLEDTAAVLGVVVAGSFMGLSLLYNSHIPDAIGSLLVGGLLAGVATFIIYTNVAALVGRSIPQERLDKINAELESDVMIRAIHDVKGIDMGNSLVRYKAEMDFDGGELTRSYLDKQDLNQMLEEIKKFKTIDELEEFMLKHGENIVDMLGGEIDRIELKLRKKHPEIRHCDLEIL